jgi:hypothetical protein
VDLKSKQQTALAEFMKSNLPSFFALAKADKDFV